MSVRDGTKPMSGPGKNRGQAQGKHRETQDIGDSNFSCRKHAQGPNTGQSFQRIVSVARLNVFLISRGVCWLQRTVWPWP